MPQLDTLTATAGDATNRPSRTAAALTLVLAACGAIALNPLPPGLEYRFIGRDLVLLDVDADLTVDVLAAVLPLS